MPREKDLEIVSKPRPPFGAILLSLLLGLTVLALGEKAYRDLGRVPTRPVHLSVRNDPELRALKSRMDTVSDTLSVYGDSLKASGLRVQELKAHYETEREAYRTLLEYRSARGITAEQPTAEDRATEEVSRTNMDRLRARWEAEDARAKQIEQEGDAVDVRLQAITAEYRAGRNVLEQKYNAARARYRAKVAFLRFLVIVPFFVLMLLAYQTTRTRRSALHLHATVGLVTAVILLLRATGEYAWKTAHYYGALVVAVAALSLVLAMILRRHQSCDRLIALRAARGECPACQLLVAPVPSVPPEVAYCPRCGTQVRRECSSCGKPLLAYLGHCPECGAPQGKDEQ